MHLRRKLAIVTHVVPPATFGSAVRLWRLFRDTPVEDYCIVTCRDLPAEVNGRLGGVHHRLPSEWRQIREPRTVLSSRVREVNRWLRVLQRARNIVRIVRAESAEMIMGLSGDLFDLPSACLAARWCRLPFVAALDDDYVYQWSNAAERRFAVRRMRRIVGNARQVIVLNEVHADDLATRYGVRAAVVRNPRESLVVQTATKWPRVNGEIHVAFTGTVYQVNVDVIHAMVAALGLSGMESVVFDIYGLLVPSDLLGAQHPRVCQCGTRSLTESLEVQRNADVLLLPLGVANSIPDVIRTASPFKMGEYLFSGRPIIACAPAESFVAQYFRRNGCGLVVDGPNPHALAEAIRRIECDAGLRKELVHNALSCAIRDFELNTVREEFRNVLEIA